MMTTRFIEMCEVGFICFLAQRLTTYLSSSIFLKKFYVYQEKILVVPNLQFEFIISSNLYLCKTILLYNIDTLCIFIRHILYDNINMIWQEIFLKYVII